MLKISKNLSLSQVSRDWCSVESASSGWTDVILLLLLHAASRHKANLVRRYFSFSRRRFSTCNTIFTYPHTNSYRKLKNHRSV
jgi:hypothetical protein